MEISLAAEPVFHIGSMPITNSLVVGVIVVVLFIILALVVSHKKLSDVPRGLQNLLETVMETVLDFMTSVTGNRDQAIKFFPLAATIFFFVLLSNWFGLLPGVGTIGIYEVKEGHTILVPLLRSASADLNTTLAIALASVIGTQIFGILAIGFVKHAGKYLNFRNPILFFVGLLELVGELARVMSFSFRLFGNVFAGEVLLLVVSALIPFIAPLPFLFLEIFVGLVQALVFSLLTLVFMTIATAEHAEH